MNYNDLLNKPMVNGTELIGNISILSLPKVSTSDVGKVAIVGEDGNWTTGTVSGGGGGFNSVTNYELNNEIGGNTND